jgi:hypothetical protein
MLSPLAPPHWAGVVLLRAGMKAAIKERREIYDIVLEWIKLVVGKRGRRLPVTAI